MLNMGGIANFTFLSGDMDSSKVFSTDTGPGNTIMDVYIQKHFPGKYFDENAAVASAGTINENLLNALKQNDFFEKPFPKTYRTGIIQSCLSRKCATKIRNFNYFATPIVWLH
jgi:anhydro-N-acetylmuramic acid kinase